MSTKQALGVDSEGLRFGKWQQIWQQISSGLRLLPDHRHVGLLDRLEASAPQGEDPVVDTGDIVRDERRGMGVVLAAGSFCQARFLRGKGRADSDGLTVLFHADLGSHFMSEAFTTTKIEDSGCSCVGL